MYCAVGKLLPTQLTPSTECDGDELSAGSLPRTFEKPDRRPRRDVPPSSGSSRQRIGRGKKRGRDRDSDGSDPDDSSEVGSADASSDDDGGRQGTAGTTHATTPAYSLEDLRWMAIAFCEVYESPTWQRLGPVQLGILPAGIDDAGKRSRRSRPHTGVQPAESSPATAAVQSRSEQEGIQDHAAAHQDRDDVSSSAAPNHSGENATQSQASSGAQQARSYSDRWSVIDACMRRTSS